MKAGKERWPVAALTAFVVVLSAFVAALTGMSSAVGADHVGIEQGRKTAVGNELRVIVMTL